MREICTAAQDAATKTTQSYFEVMMSAAPGAVRQDPDGIHDLRVASRRTRAALAEFKDQYAPAPWKRTQAQVRNVTRRLGRARELDVNRELLEAWPHSETDTARAHALRQIEAHRIDAANDVAEAAQDVLSEGFWDSFDALLAGYRPTTDCLLKCAQARLDRRLKQAKKKYKKARKSRSDDDIHALRIQFKKLRYTIEIYRGLYGNPGKQFRKACKQAQDSLGIWNDYRVLIDAVTDFREQAPSGVAIALDGLLTDLHDHTAALRRQIDQETQEFFTKERMAHWKDVIAHPQVPCCRNSS